MIQRIRQEKMLQSTGTTFKKSSFQSLKQAKENFSKQIKLRSKKMKKQKFLKQEIYKNHNIFHSLTNVNHFSKTMTAQNIIWTKNYELKEGINKLKEENSSLKARIWNVEKENRKMDRQIETWGLKKTLGSGVVGNSNGKPYIDTATAQKVLNDQDYSITSIKIMIMQMEQQLQKLTQTLESSLVQKKNIRNIRNDMKHELNSKKVEMWKGFLWNEECEKYNEEQLQIARQQKRDQLVEKNQELEFILKNTEMKRKTRVTLEEELAKISGQLDGLSDISKEKIAVMQEQARKLRTEDESYVNEEVKKLANVKERYLQFECKTQDKMGQFIKRKIQLNKEMAKMSKKLLKIDTSSKNESQKPLTNLIQPSKPHTNAAKPKETQSKQVNNNHNNKQRNLVVDLLQGKVVQPDREVYYEAYLGKAQFLKDNKVKSVRMDD